MSHSVIFEGGIKPGVSRAEAQAGLARLFRVQDSGQLDRYFSGASVVIKSGLEADQAERYRQALDEAGLLVQVRDDDAGLFDIPAPRKNAEGLIETAPAPAQVALAPLSITPAANSSPVPEARPDDIGQLSYTAPGWSAEPAVPPPPRPQPVAAAEPATAPVRVWWVLRGGERLGPYSREELAAMSGAGGITPLDQIWKAGLKNPVAPASLSWLNLPDPALAELLRPEAPPAPYGAAPYSAAPPPARAVQDADALLASARLARPESSGPGAAVIVALLVLLPLNFILGVRSAPPSSQGLSGSFSVGYGLGAALVWPLIVMGISSLWASNRQTATRLRVMMYTSLAVTVLLVMQAGVKVTGHSGSGVGDLELAMASKLLNQTLPRMVDATTRLDSTSAAGHTLTYNYTLVNITASQMDMDRFTSVVRSKLQKDVCGNPTMQQQMKRGVSYRYSYKGSDQQMLVDVTLDAAGCGLDSSG